jgi:hypothetical protein
VNRADQLLEVGFFLADDRLIAILEKLTGTMMPTVKGHNVAGEELTHNGGDAGRPTAKEEMGVIGKKGPGIAGGLCFRKQRGQASDELISIPVIPEDIPSLDPPDHDMVECTGNIEAGLTGHMDERTSEGPWCYLNG